MRFLRKYAFLILIPLAILLIPSLNLVASGQTPSTIQRQVVEYSQGGQLLEGYLAFDPAQSGPRPGVLVVHEWKGINDYVKSRVDQLAEMGYIAFAADIYGKGIRPQTNEEAREQATLYRSNRSLLRDRVNAGLNLLRNHPLSEDNRLAAIGYCFGGGTVLELARSGADVQGVVSFHGNLDTPNPDDAEQIQARVLVLHGADDPLVPDEQVAAFQKEMREAKVDWQLISYGGAVHSFTNPDAGSDPSQGSAYNAEVNRRSWQHMKQFFTEIFQD